MFSKSIGSLSRRKRNIHQQLEERPDDYSDSSDGWNEWLLLHVDSDQSVVYKSDTLGVSVPSLTMDLKKEEGKKEKKTKAKANTLFQISLRDSLLSFASSDTKCTSMFQLCNKSSDFCFHFSPGPYLQLRHQYDTSKDFSTIVIDVNRKKKNKK